MRLYNSFPFYTYNRFSDRTVVHFILEYSHADLSRLGADVKRLATLQLAALRAANVPELMNPPSFKFSKKNPAFAGAELLCQMAILFQRRCGHEVGYFSVETLEHPTRYRCLVEHEHCDVCLTAVKLAWEVFSGSRPALRDAFLAFKNFARQFRLPAQTHQLLAAAADRGIPSRKLDRIPFSRKIQEKNLQRKLPNGLVTLGHGAHTVMLEGLECIGPASRCADMSSNANQETDPARIDRLLDRLFPGNQNGTIPLLTVTGTNGKTTTSRMAAHILVNAGARPGLACSDGLYSGHALLAQGEFAGIGGQYEILCRDDIDCAVLETHHQALFQSGTPYLNSNVAVCLNVTRDHLHKGVIETVEEMAEVKRALLERATDAVVLFADDDRCMGMLPKLNAANTCLVSLSSTHDEIQQFAGRPVDTCTLGPEGQVVLTRIESAPLDLCLADAIPATQYGAAQHNLSNAMHAMAATTYLGVDPAVIGKSMRTFGSGYDQTPGRLNVHDNGQFLVLMDIAHNPDGFRKLVEFTDRRAVSGRRLISFSLSGDRPQESVDESMQELAGHFDHYVVRAFRRKRDKTYEQVREGLKSGLLKAGVKEDRISIEQEFEGEIDRFLSTANPGDLAVFISGTPDIHHSWESITTFRPS